MGLLDGNTVIVHGLAIDRDGAALVKERRASLILCPSSNHYLYGRFPNLEILGAVENIALGNDSPLTAKGDLLDEIRFAVDACGIPATQAYRMVTSLPASILGLENGEGSLRESCVADLIAIRDTGQTPAARLRNLSATDVELVMIGGRVLLVSDALRNRLPVHAMQGLELLEAGGTTRWIRAPVRRLLDSAEAVLGKGSVHFAERSIASPAPVEACHAT
jgi:cytosine/adenosine deaminase-related metal-dependent hydrolase